MSVSHDVRLHPVDNRSRSGKCTKTRSTLESLELEHESLAHPQISHMCPIPKRFKPRKSLFKYSRTFRSSTAPFLSTITAPSGYFVQRVQQRRVPDLDLQLLLSEATSSPTWEAARSPDLQEALGCGSKIPVTPKSPVW